MARPPRELELADTSCYICPAGPPLIHRHTPRRCPKAPHVRQQLRRRQHIFSVFNRTGASSNQWVFAVVNIDCGITDTKTILLFPNFFDSQLGHEYALGEEPCGPGTPLTLTLDTPMTVDFIASVTQLERSNMGGLGLAKPKARLKK